eukprot:TRINITY_DN3266_c1_g11_i1.p1 TRINITY_DN3266_c1_g11~~TRINITY_DN3266_c1_g11_i1.p1  ORF type:complete len:406 (-),score=83.26 TRINITY_DN3266_c1_g11_i1:145-1362(-)
MSSVSNREFVRQTIHATFSHEINEGKLKKIGLRRNLNSIVYMWDAEYSLDDKYLIMGSSLGNTYVFNPETGRLIRTLKDHTTNVYGVSFSPNGQTLATCSYDKTIIIYSLPDFSILFKLSNRDPVCAICFSHCSNYIYACDDYGTLKKWDITNANVVLEKRVHSRWIWRVKLSSDGKYLLTGSDDETASLINPDTFSVVRTFEQRGDIRDVCFHPNRRIIAVGDRSMEVKLWNMDDGSLFHKFNLEDHVWGLQFLNPFILLVLSADGFLTSFNLDTFQELQKVNSDACNTGIYITVSHDGTSLACGRCRNNIIKIFSMKLDYDPSYQSELIELSKNGGYVLLNLIAMNIDTQVIRQLVSAGICINEEEHRMIVDTCWDLAGLNETNGGNMCNFMDETIDESDDDD